MAVAQGESASRAEFKRVFQQFLRAEDPDSPYGQRIGKLVETTSQRLIVSVNDLRDFNAEFTARLIERPLEHVPVMEEAIKEVVSDKDPTFFSRLAEKNRTTRIVGSDKADRILLGFEGNFGAYAVTPRTVGADHVSRLVSVEGIVTRCALVRPKLVRTVHYCPATKDFSTREFRDGTDMTGVPTGTVYPSKDDAGNLLETEFGLSTYKDSQFVTIQEMPESAPLGQLPRSLEVYLERDLVDSVKPGDRICVVGIYRAMVGANVSFTNGVFRSLLLCGSVSRLNREVGAAAVSGPDLRNMREFAKRPDFFAVLARSLAPSIHGHDRIKEALALLLAGGLEHNLPNGTHIRGDINMLLVGDPSTAKSQLLRFVLNIAPLAVNTTGRGSSGVGLTAAVTTDPDTGERRLEAGAMVLADRGVVCIDEFDKMSDADRVAIHEVMEQQTVTIAKAGIQASLNARCSVVAAANPIYGRFDNSLPLARNVALPDSLISRFDMLFIVRDRVEPGIDSRLADHVLRMHRFVRPGQEGVPVPLDVTAALRADQERQPESAAAAGAAVTSEIWQKYNPLLHGGAFASPDEEREGNDDEDDDEEGGGASNGPGRKKRALLRLEWIRKYITAAKNNAARLSGPRLTKPAAAAIVETYSEFRSRAADRATVITARSLETLIRLASAHAKLRFSPEVSPADVAVAKDIMLHALYGDAQVRKQEGLRSAPGRKGGPAPGGHEGGGDDDDEEGDDDMARGGAGSKRRRSVDDGGAGGSEEAAAPPSSGARKSPRSSRRQGSSAVAASSAASDGLAFDDEEEEGGSGAPGLQSQLSMGASSTRSRLSSQRRSQQAEEGDGADEAVLSQLASLAQAGEAASSAAAALVASDVGRTVTAALASYMRAHPEAEAGGVATEALVRWIASAAGSGSQGPTPGRAAVQRVLEAMETQGVAIIADGHVHVV